jgi:acyl-CoA synthetase (AMP-forming)/AMP-acid ligase II
VGEIWVAGPNVSCGYWNRRHESEEVFEAYQTATAHGRFLRTGDLGFIHEGLLFVTGRIKDLIIIAGRNHYPQDIELTAEQCHPALRCAAFSIDGSGDEQLVVVVEVEQRLERLRSINLQAGARSEYSTAILDVLRSADLSSIASTIRRVIWKEHELSIHKVVFLKQGTVPKTSSGKIRRRACRASYLDGTLTSIRCC